MEKIKLLAFDLDGTVLTSENTLPESVRQSLIRAAESGVVLVAASGRPYGSMPESILSLRGLSFCIASNGAAIYDGNGKKLFSSLLDCDCVNEFLEMTNGCDLILEAFIDGKTYTDKRYCDDPVSYGCSQAYIDYVKSSHASVEDMRAFVARHSSELDSIEVVCTDKALRTELRKKLENKLNKVYVTSSSENFIELMSAQATKANAVRHICEITGISPEQAAACGNADNDADMIKFCGLGAAVKNSSPQCLGSADIVIPSNNECGVCELVDIILND